MREISSPYSFCYLIIRNVHWLMKLLVSIFHGSLMRTAEEEKGESLTVSKQKVFVSCSANHSVFTSIYFENAATSLSFWPQSKTTQKVFNCSLCQGIQFIFALAYSRSTITDISVTYSVLRDSFWFETRKNINKTRIWHVPAKHANRMDARAHSSSLAECAPRIMTPRSQGFVCQSSPNLAHV